ncbi:MAG: hypothetical protein HQM00_08520, partial [Magnetococcales bacterium]|nr:hypothetical protein [Magnetococcales bacterium]
YNGSTLVSGVYRGNDYRGGAGNDLLRGTAYADRYYFDRGDGQDVIVENGSTSHKDRIELGTGILPAAVTLLRTGNDLVLDLGEGERITVKDRFANTSYKVEELAFADGTVWNLDLTAAIFMGTEGNDTLVGNAWQERYRGNGGDDIIGGMVGSADYYGYTIVNGVYQGNDYEGGTGNDLLRGTYYSDRYYFNAGDGQDTIEENSGASHEDRLVLGAGISAADLFVTNDGTNLILGVGNGGDRITVKNWYTGPAYRLEALQFADGTVWSQANMQAKGSSSLYGGVAADILAGGAEWNSYYGQEGDDVLGGVQGGTDWSGSVLVNGVYRGNDYWGGAGNDLLRGSNASDHYFFQRGDGHDTILDHSGNGVNAGNNTDLIQFGVGVNYDAIMLEKEGMALNLRYGSGDRVRIENWENGEADQVERIQAGDGSVLRNNQVDQLIQAMAIFSASHDGISWEQSLAHYGDETRAILAANWQQAA